MKGFITNKKLKKLTAYTLSLLFILLLWQILSGVIKSSLILPSPTEVIKSFPNVVTKSGFWISFAATTARVLIAAFISVITGTIVGILAGNFPFFNDFISVPLGILKSTPVIAIILVALFWFNSTILPVLVSVLMTLPVMISQIRGGILSTPSEKLFLAACHNFGFIKKVIYFQWPSAKTSFYEGMLQVFSMSWKVVAAGEVLCLPSYAVGSHLSKAQVHLESAQMLSEVIILVAVSVVSEALLKLYITKKSKKMTKEEN